MYVFFVLMVLEGGLRKWVLPSLSTEVYLLKYVVLFSALIIFLTGNFAQVRKAACLTKGEAMIWFVWMVLFTAFFVSSEFSVISLAGALYYLGPLPVLLLFPVMAVNPAHFSRLVVIYLGVAIGISLLGLLQYASPADSALNVYVNNDVGDVATFGVDILGVSRVRITGTFSYISSYTIYLQFIIPLAWASLLNASSNRDQIISAVALTLLMVNIAMTGSRAPFLYAVVGSIPFLFSAFSSGGDRTAKMINRLVLVLVVLGGSVYLMTGVLAYLEERNEGAGDSEARVTGALLTPYNTFRDAQPFGDGIGSTAYNVALATNQQSRVSQTFDEIVNDRVGIETGYVGYGFLLFVKIYFVLIGIFSYLRARLATTRRWIMVAVMYQVTTLWAIPVHSAVGFIEYLTSISMVAWLRSAEVGGMRYGG